MTLDLATARRLQRNKKIIGEQLIQKKHMPIYTKTGDGGETSTFNGKRISKASPEIFACGSLDELSSFIGLVIAETNEEKKLLSDIQKDLYQIMAFLSGSKTDISFLKSRVKFIEQFIDQTSEKLPKLNRFILPQGTKTTSWFHVLRTVCRRAERVVVKYHNGTRKINPLVLIYLNRLSDLFFILARKHNQKQEISV